MIGEPESRSDAIPISLVAHHVSCPRRAWLEAMGETTDTYQMAVGTQAHRASDDPAESRPDRLCAVDVRSAEFGVTGRCDDVDLDAEGGATVVESSRRRSEAAPRSPNRWWSKSAALRETGMDVVGAAVQFTEHHTRVDRHLTRPGLVRGHRGDGHRDLRDEGAARPHGGPVAALPGPGATGLLISCHPTLTTGLVRARSFTHDIRASNNDIRGRLVDRGLGMNDHDFVQQLNALADLRSSGAITEEEFTRAKGGLLVWPPAPPSPVVVQAPAPSGSTPQNGLGVAGFVLGLLGLIFCWVPGLGVILAVLGVVFGAAGISNGQKRGIGTGMPVAGLVCGIIALILIVIAASAAAA